MLLWINTVGTAASEVGFVEPYKSRLPILGMGCWLAGLIGGSAWLLSLHF